ncbi:MAG: histidine phosphatase family protein [Chloroflexi bacterium]|nr:histidine phosphatase family protein [Chloroflexota bacterium]
MSTLLLIRHAENDYVKKGRMAGRTPGVHLNEKGRAQAQTLAEKLSKAPVKAIYSSPLERCLETAAPLAQALGLEVTPAAGLMETDVGEWAGQTLKSLRRLKAWRAVQITPSLFRFPGGESFAEAQLRITAEILAIAARYEAKDMLALFSHGDPIRLAVAYFLGMPLDHFQRLSASTASITALHLGEGGARLLNLNYDPGFSFTPP